MRKKRKKKANAIAYSRMSVDYRTPTLHRPQGLIWHPPAAIIHLNTRGFLYYMYCKYVVSI